VTLKIFVHGLNLPKPF